VVIPDDAYGGTYRLFAEVLGRWGVEHTPVALSDVDAVRAAVRPTTSVLWVETPTNPLLAIADIAQLASVASDAGALLVVDNTFASPYLQQPLSLGADIVVHSTTKYLGGHSDVVGGAAIVRDPALHEQVRFVQNAVGAVPGPFDCFLVHRGLRTLHLRVAAHDANGMAVSAWLKEQAGVDDVRWPGFGGMVSFRHPDAARICTATKLFSLAESLGGVESLIEVPAIMTHKTVEDSAAAVPADLIRLSCGVEASEDLIADLAQAIGVPVGAAVEN
jgi:cystathionine gamma-synthase